MPGRALLVLAVLVAATAFGLWWRARNGRYVPVPAQVVAAASDSVDTAPDPHRASAAEIGAPLGADVTFLQFSSEVCAPCRRVRVVLAQLADERPGVAHVEVGVEDHLALVRRFGVLRTPTVLLLDADGLVVGRLSGAMDRRHALAALESCPGGLSAR